MTLRAERLTHVYFARTPLQRVGIDDVSFQIGPGECVAIVGVSGSGKSTLARVLAGLLPPAAGHVYFEDQEITATPLTGGWSRRAAAVRRALARLWRMQARSVLQRRHWHVSRGRQRAPVAPPVPRPVMLAFQNPEEQFFMGTVLDEVGVGLAPVAVPAGNEQAAARHAAVVEALRTAELDPAVYGKRNPFTLSGGEQRRLALAVLLARKPSVLILDEPSAGLDEPGRRTLYECIERVRRERKTAVVLVSHDLEEVAAVAERTVVLAHGRIALEGPTSAVLQDAQALEHAGLLPPPLVRLQAALAARGHRFGGDWTQPEEAAEALLSAPRALGADSGKDAQRA
ncbi:MAG TPA: ATP-binding cassette domain-containing protein [Dehalococcoidia bacterium]|nr:ATP-binding cassette domain-containing protein [Dehalococcoidia bacterium]